MDDPAKGNQSTILGTYRQTIVKWIIPKGDGHWDLNDENCNGHKYLMLTSVRIIIFSFQDCTLISM